VKVVRQRRKSGHEGELGMKCRRIEIKLCGSIFAEIKEEMNITNMSCSREEEVQQECPALKLDIGRRCVSQRLRRCMPSDDSSCTADVQQSPTLPISLYDAHCPGRLLCGELGPSRGGRPV